MPSTPGRPADPHRPGAPAPGEDRLVAGRGMRSSSTPPAAGNDWFTRPSREQRERREPIEPQVEAQTPAPGPAPANRPVRTAPPSGTAAPPPGTGRSEASDGVIRVELASQTPRRHAGGALGDRRRTAARRPKASGRKPALTVAAVTAAAGLAIGTGVVLDRLVLTELRSEPTAAGRTAPEDAAPAPGTDLEKRRDAGGSGPVPTPSQSAPPLKRLPDGTARATPSPGSSEAGGAEGGSSGGALRIPGATVAETTVVLLTNKERAAEGCAPLRADTRLTLAAKRHSADMAENDYFSHTSRNGDSPWTRMEEAGYPSPGAENIAKGYSTAAAVVEGWMNSPGHRANILNCKLRAIGVGMANGPGGPLWTQNFGWT